MVKRLCFYSSVPLVSVLSLSMSACGSEGSKAGDDDDDDAGDTESDDDGEEVGASDDDDDDGSGDDDDDDRPDPETGDYLDLLDFSGVPRGRRDGSVHGFADRGAWFAFGLPDRDSGARAGGFTGPFAISTQTWQGPAALRLRIEESGEAIDFDQVSDAGGHAYPGVLRQDFELEGLGVSLSLRFVSARTVLVAATVSNLGDETRDLGLGWEGEAFESRFSEEEGLIRQDGDEGEFIIRALGADDSASLESYGDRFRLDARGDLSLAAGASETIYVAYSYALSEGDWAEESEWVDALEADPAAAMDAERERWREYLAGALVSDRDWEGETELEAIAVKSVMTLMLNWRSPAGDLLHDGLFPSYPNPGFQGFWSWDSWKHSVALTSFAPELAKDGMRTLFDHQLDSGMIPDVIYRDSDENNLLNTKPPLAAWAVWEIYQSTQDEAFVAEMFPALVRYHEWWYAERDFDDDGLCEYGSSVPATQPAKWESGMDNAVRFDDSEIAGSMGRYSLDQESADLNAYLAAEKRILGEMATLLGESGQAEAFVQAADDLEAEVRTTFFDPDDGFFYDRKIDGGDLISVQGADGWIPLFCGVASSEQASAVASVMLDEAKFAGFVPFPTLSAEHPRFTPSGGYWRGPVWLDQAYFGVRALERYGFVDDADALTLKLFDNLEGVKDSDLPLRENYDPSNGRGQDTPHFAWSAAHLLLLYQGR